MFYKIFKIRTIAFFLFFIGSSLAALLLIPNLQDDSYINANLVSQQNQQIIRQADLKFREDLINKYQQTFKPDSLNKIIRLLSSDSSTIYKELHNYLLLNFAQTIQDTNYRIKITVDKIDQGAYNYDSIDVRLIFEKDKFLQIFQNFYKFDDAKKFILYGNYLLQKCVIQKKISSSTILVDILICLLASIFISYLVEKRFPFLSDLEYAKDKMIIDNDKNEKNILKSISEQQTEDVTIKSKELRHLFDELNKYKTESRTMSILNENVLDFSKKSKEMSVRSSLFLSLSFFISIFGIAIFYIILPEFKPSYKLTDYLGLSIRPILILTFFQSLSFYLVKQYKYSISDYKYFYKEEKKQNRYAVAYKLLKDKNENEIRKLIGFEILKEKNLFNEITVDNETETKEENVYDNFIKIINDLKDTK